MISRSESRKSRNSSGGSTLRRRRHLQGDPFVRKRGVRYIAIIDQGLAGILLFYAAYRLVNYDFKNQSLIYLIGANGNIFIAMIYWLGVFTLIGLQLVTAFLLLTATKDMTTDPETMMKKCKFWRTFSIVLLVFTSVDLVISIHIYFQSDEDAQRLVPVVLDSGELIFRIFGVFMVQKFIGDLQSIFAEPITKSTSSSPVIPPRGLSRNSSFYVGEGGSACSRTHSMNAHGESILGASAGQQHDENLGIGTQARSVPKRTGSMSIDIVPKFSRTSSVNYGQDRPTFGRTTSIPISEGSVGRGSRNSDGALILNIDEDLPSPTNSTLGSRI